jgi:hypothetical protein
LRYEFDPKAGIILVTTRLYRPRGDAIADLASAKVTPRNGDLVIKLQTEK